MKEKFLTISFKIRKVFKVKKITHAPFNKFIENFLLNYLLYRKMIIFCKISILFHKNELFILNFLS